MTIFYLLLLLFIRGNHASGAATAISDHKTCCNTNPYSNIAAIPLPAGYTRAPVPAGSFAAWLRQLPLKKNQTVYIYNGLPKANQAAQFAVIDISTGNKDLQQCADAVMRLRAEYLYSRQRFTAIDFTDNHQTHYRLPANASRATFDQYLEKVFSFCGTASLEKQLAAVTDYRQIKAGDVLIKGGSPGHAIQVMDLATGKEGKIICLLAQSYMPAQDMHVVLNPTNAQLSPWYEIDAGPFIITPEWVFKINSIKKWPPD